jgi:hypothetical protein
VTTVTTTLEIDRPASEVFEAATDTSNWLAISPGLLDIQPRGRIAIGTKGTMVRKQGRRRVEGTWEVAGLTPGSRIVMRGGEPGIATHEEIGFAELPGGKTRLTSTMTFEPQRLQTRLLLPLLGPVIRRSVRRDYARLKAHLEGGA